jgi:hypothetical protein
MELLGHVCQVECRFGPLGTVSILASDKCMVCAKCTVGRKSFLLHSMDLLGDVGQMEACFGPFGDSVNLHRRLLHRFALNVQ